MLENDFIDKELWDRASRDIDWFQKPSSILGTRSGPNPYTWFPNGKLNTCYNCLDRHIEHGDMTDQPCLIWDSAMTKTKQIYTYGQALEQVQTLAGLYHSYGLSKGDVVMIYMPMVPEAVFAFLACARLGVVHSVVFGGFAPKELAKRIDDCKPKVILTASCGIEPKRVIPYKPLLEEALKIANHHVPIRVVFQRPNQIKSLLNYAQGDRDYEDEMEKIRSKKAQYKQCVPVDSDDPLYVLYTSGTTGQPKGVVRSNGGHAVVLRWSIDYVFNVRKGDVIFTASDIGWAVSHSYTVYGPMLVGATTILYEGKPVGTPDASAFWRLVSEYKAKTMFTAPTAIRAIAREDPEGLLAKKYNMKSLTSLFLAGERSDPETLKWCQSVVHENCTVIDNYWSTELGSPVTAICAGVTKNTRSAVKWGSAGKQVPGSRICILDENSLEEIKEPNQFGNIVLKLPLPPGAFPNLWNNESGYKASYFDKYPGYYDTGDAGLIDAEGYVHIMSRTDDIINVAGHRLSTGSIEQILISHPLVVECCVVPLPDKLKGHIPLGIVVLKHKKVTQADKHKLNRELVDATRRDLGAIACFEKAVVVSRLPKTRSGKVLRRSIREMVDGKAVNIPATIEDEDALYEIYSTLKQEHLIPLNAPPLLKSVL
ncbi:AMP-dependent synthetase and ligase [Blakeslea trispora]|nr:AMP-dependent synthetase and ligase [Blakeslea trispora]